MKDKIFPISMMIMWGTVFYTATHNLSLGMCIGVAMGAAFGMFGSDKGDNDAED